MKSPYHKTSTACFAVVGSLGGYLIQIESIQGNVYVAWPRFLY